MTAQIVAATSGHQNSVSSGDSRWPTGVSVTALPRCNFAGFCNYCGEQACRSRDCIVMYLDTWWAACEICGGVGGDGLGLDCLCTYGVVQVGSERPGAVQPR
jgi:hypothetical protein